MKKGIFAVTGATGQIGSELTERLLSQGHAVRAIGRDAGHLEDLARRGADAYSGSLSNPTFLTAVFKGTDGVFAMVPPDYGSEHMFQHQRAISDAEALAIADAGVRRVVVLSSVGAEREEGTGLIKGIHYHERRLAELSVGGVDVLALRCGYFMENFLHSIEMIRDKDIHGGALEPDLALPMIATKDIALEVAKHLTLAEIQGYAIEYALGPRDVTPLEATRILGQAIGKPDLLYVQLSYEDLRTALLSNGMAEAVADAMVEMLRAYNDGLVQPTVPRSERNTTPTRIEQWSKMFAAAYRKASGAVHVGRRGA